ncbi:MAG: hypothetical protein ABIA74_00285 [bacterium]
MNLKIFLSIFCLILTSNLFGIIQVESPDKTKTAYFDDNTKFLMVQIKELEKPIKILNFEYKDYNLKEILWTQDSKYLIVNIEIVEKENKYNLIERMEIIENNPKGKELTPFRKENLKTQITLIETLEFKIEEKTHQLIKIEILFIELNSSFIKWLDIETGKFLDIEN